MRWQDLPWEARESLSGRLAGLWGWPSDQEAFDSLALDKQQALLLLMRRLREKRLWDFVKRIDNVYGLDGVGIDFTAWPGIQATLSRRKDFTRRFARRKAVSGGFYETGRAASVLHFLYRDGKPRIWHVHFDLHNPLHSLGSALRHWRYEYWGKLNPDWRAIKNTLERSDS